MMKSIRLGEAAPNPEDAKRYGDSDSSINGLIAD
jgi:hypothetical protein